MPQVAPSPKIERAGSRPALTTFVSPMPINPGFSSLLGGIGFPAGLRAGGAFYSAHPVGQALNALADLAPQLQALLKAAQ